MHSFHVKANIGDEEIRVVGAKWRVTSRIESNNLGRWFVPQINLIGKFGSPNGPSQDEAFLIGGLSHTLYENRRGQIAAPLSVGLASGASVSSASAVT